MITNHGKQNPNKINKNIMTYNISLAITQFFASPRGDVISRDDLHMRYDTETYSLEIVFTFRNDPSLSHHSKLPHGLSSLWCTFLSQMCWLHDNAQVSTFHLAVMESV